MGRGEALIKMKEVGEFLLHRYDTSRASNDQEICRIPNSISGPLALTVGVPVAFLSEFGDILILFKRKDYIGNNYYWYAKDREEHGLEVERPFFLLQC